MAVRRLAKFRVSSHLVHDLAEELARVFDLMRFVKVDFGYLWDHDCFEYTGTSPLFDEVEVGCETPLVDLWVSHDRGKILDVRAVPVPESLSPSRAVESLSSRLAFGQLSTDRQTG